MMFTSDLEVFLPQSLDDDEESSNNERRYQEKYSRISEEDRRILSMDGKTISLTRTVVDRVSEDLNVLVNEPSLGLYRVQEHVRRSVPLLVAKKKEMAELSARLQGMVYDVEYSTSCVKDMATVSHFSAIQKYMQQSILYKERLNQMQKELRDRQK